ncbi:MAG: LamG-like jellyroll fold domain-containing protein, partial [Candidatus Aenigmatarchaeota archaeon]
MHSSKFFNRLLITGFVLVACCFFVQFNAHATTIIFSENFDSATPPGLPTNWVQIDISGTQGNWATNTSTVHPSGYAPHSSPNLAWFNSWTASSGSSTRLYYSLPIALPSDQYIELSFWMFHDGQYSNMDRIQVQFSNDGVTWYDVGSPILRYSAGSTEWREHSLDISAYAGQTILLGFLGISAYGNDIHIDDISISASPGYPLPSGAISWWMAEDNAYDSIGPNNGTLQGDATFADGKVGRAFLLDGTGDYITTSDSPDWDLGTGDFTIEAWINTPTPDATMRLIAAGTESAGAYQMWAFGYGSHPVWGTGSRLNFAYYNGSGYTDLNSYEINLTQDEWHHIAVVRSSTNLTFYFDGVEAGTQSIGSISLVGGGTGALIGARYALGSPTEFASGLIDEVSIYNRALSADEIADIYNFGSLGKYPLASLNVTKYGNGTVITNDLGINCGDDCIQFYYPGTAVCLIALPDAGYTFAGWTGDADCEDGILTMGYLTYVTCKAIFIKNPKVILLSPNGGEVLSAGVTSTIEWIEPANAHHFTLKLSMDNGMTWSTIATNVTGNS